MKAEAVVFVDNYFRNPGRNTWVRFPRRVRPDDSKKVNIYRQGWQYVHN